MTNTPATRHYQHYEVLQHADGSPWELGRGAMGTTYKAYDVNLCCEVALKVVNAALLDNPDARERFVREARAAAALRHRHVASVYHLGNDGEHFFYAMEFIDGENLDALVRRLGPLPVGTVLEIVLQVAKALVAAERQRLVHRDIKPANLMVVHDEAEDGLTVKVIDFGLARPTAGTENFASVTLGGFVGTPQYASPEQLEERPLDARSDLYSLGVTAWYLLTGRPPFSGSLATVCQQQLSKPPPWELLPYDLPESVRSLLRHLLEKDPADRPQTARALRAEVEACLHELPPGAVKPDRPPLPLSRTASAAPGTAAEAASETAAPPQTFAAGRYVVTASLGEEFGTRLYRARDARQAGQPVTVRRLPLDWLSPRADGRDLAEEVRHVQAAAHPHLVKIHALEPGQNGVPDLLIEEALVSFTLRDLLAARDGSLPPKMALAFVEQAAAALDHAARCRLPTLELTLAHNRVHFPFADPAAPGNAAAREMLGLPFGDWPAWSLKLHPLASYGVHSDHGTWAGSVTLVRPTLPWPDSAGSATPGHGNVAKLANLTYELLGGTPSHLLRQRRTSLSSLSEAGNAVLSAAASESAAYADCRAFHLALADEVNEGREAILHSPAVRPSSAAAAPRVPPSAPATAIRAAAGTASPTTRNSALAAAANPAPDTTVVDHPWQEQTLPVNEDLAVAEHTAWERMALARSHEARPGRWVLGGVIGVIVFLGAFAGVFALLLNKGAPRRAHAAQEAPRADPLPRGSSVPPTVAARRVSAIPAPTPISAQQERTVQATATEAVSPLQSGGKPVATSSVEPTASVAAAAVPDQAADAAPSPSIEAITVHLASEPTGAAIWWHDKLIGITPADVALPLGTQTLIARKRGSLDTVQFLRVEPGSNPQATMIRLMPPNRDPTWQDKPGASPSRVSPARAVGFPSSVPSPSIRVQPALPVNPPVTHPSVPVSQPFPLQPFEHLPDRSSAPDENDAPGRSGTPRDDGENL